MRQTILILMLSICVWNVFDVPSFEKDSHSSDAPHSSQVKQSQPVQTLASQLPSEDENGIPCDSENCCFHRCHLGHCSFTAVTQVSYSIPESSSLGFCHFEEHLASVYLSFPTEPPQV